MHRDPALRIDVAETCLRFHEGVFLIRRVIGALDHDIRLRHGHTGVAAAQADRAQHVVRVFGVEDRRAGAEGLRRISQHGQVLICDRHQGSGRRRLFWCLGDHGRNPVAHKAHYVGAEDRLIRNHQAVKIVGYILCGEDHVYARAGAGLRCIQIEDPRVGPPSEHQLHVQHAGHAQISGVHCASGDLRQRVLASDGVADGDHQWASRVKGLPSAPGEAERRPTALISASMVSTYGIISRNW